MSEDLLIPLRTVFFKQARNLCHKFFFRDVVKPVASLEYLFDSAMKWRLSETFSYFCDSPIVP